MIKYVSLTFHSVVKNLSPIATLGLSHHMLGEKIKISEIIFSIASLIGVVLIIIGYADTSTYV